MMRKPTALIAALTIVPWLVCQAAQAGSDQKPPQRIVSLIPAVTEMLFAIGAGPQVVGVSSFDHFPPEVAKLQKVGALLDPDLERILSLRPDLAIVYGTQTDLRAQLGRAGVPMYVYTHGRLGDITVTLKAVGARAGHADDADALAQQIDGRVEFLRRRVAGRPKPRTLIVFGRESFALRGIYASGGVGFIHDMVAAAGGANVFADIQRESVQASTELILARRPDVVLELRGNALTAEETAREKAVWKALPAVPAVRTGRILIFVDERTVTPGPRVAEGVEVIARALHPDVFR
jgi:iron complex transport system substrate-binding protein